MVSLLALPGCEQGGQGSDRVHSFVTLLSQPQLAAAYDAMCPEYREAHSSEQFEQTIRSFPYLQGVRGVECTGWTTIGVLTEVPCHMENTYGRMTMTVVTRVAERDACIVSMEVAGLPVVGYDRP